MRPLESQNFAGRKQTKKIPQLQTHATFHEKGRMTQRAEPTVQEVEPCSAPRYLHILPYLGHSLSVLPLSNLVSSSSQGLSYLVIFTALSGSHLAPSLYLLTIQIPFITYLKKFLRVFNHKSHPII